jgi:hypothetical protein
VWNPSHPWKTHEIDQASSRGGTVEPLNGYNTASWPPRHCRPWADAGVGRIHTVSMSHPCRSSPSYRSPRHFVVLRINRNYSRSRSKDQTITNLQECPEVKENVQCRRHAQVQYHSTSSSYMPVQRPYTNYDIGYVVQVTKINILGIDCWGSMQITKFLVLQLWISQGSIY